MNRIERTPFNEYESLCQFSEQPRESVLEGMESGFQAFLAIMAWLVIVAICCWFLAELAYMAKNYPDWKWQLNPPTHNTEVER